jgi:ABC-type multidrug transport system ATPase subunit
MSEAGGKGGVTKGKDTLLELRNWSLVRDTPAGPITLLRDIDLDIQCGEWIGILGANGSGKTSLLRFLAGENSPLAERAALIFQDPDEQIIAASVAEELALGRPALTKAEAVQAVLREFDLARFARLDPRLLSAGQKQRLAVAVAECGQPPVAPSSSPPSAEARPKSLATCYCWKVAVWWPTVRRQMCCPIQRRSGCWGRRRRA